MGLIFYVVSFTKNVFYRRHVTEDFDLLHWSNFICFGKCYVKQDADFVTEPLQKEPRKFINNNDEFDFI